MGIWNGGRDCITGLYADPFDACGGGKNHASPDSRFESGSYDYCANEYANDCAQFTNIHPQRNTAPNGSCSININVAAHSHTSAADADAHCHTGATHLDAHRHTGAADLDAYASAGRINRRPHRT
jgi:hypothetical protein